MDEKWEEDARAGIHHTERDPLVRSRAMPWKIAPDRLPPVNVWKQMLKEEGLQHRWQNVLPYHEMPDLEHVTLTPGRGDFLSLSDPKIKKEWNHKYYRGNIPLTITKNTIFWYPKGHYDMHPPDGFPDDYYQIFPPDPFAPPEHKGKEIAGIFLKGVLDSNRQQLAWQNLEQLDWGAPSRKETKSAVNEKVQVDNSVTPRELSIGWSRFALAKKPGQEKGEHHIGLTKQTWANKDRLDGIGALVQQMDHVFHKVLPFYGTLQNQREHDPEERKILDDPEWVNSGNYVREWLTSFSATTLLRSCPASIHKDRNANLGQTNFACLTSVGENFSGGPFCLIQHGIKIPIKPGDLFIGQTTREWHCNVDLPVVGTKYSIICYYHPRAAKPGIPIHDTSSDSDTGEDLHVPIDTVVSE